MFKYTMEFEDLEGKEVAETFYFNYNKLEIAKMLEFDQLEAKLEKLTKRAEDKGLSEAENSREAYDIFEQLIAGAYGEKSADNMHFVKSEAITERWKNHVAFVEMIFNFLEDPKLAIKFLEDCLPQKMLEAAKREIANAENVAAVPPTAAEISSMVDIAAARQENPETAIAPASAVKVTDGKTDDELLELSPREMTPAQMQRAFVLKTGGQ